MVVIPKVGQQMLVVFVVGTVTAQVLGIVLDHAGRNDVTIAAANLAGFAILIFVAHGVAWSKSVQGKKVTAKRPVFP
ncbi:hypothetical protein GCM10007874_41190 [Labrys miyagiensis]|uniref:Uncharacterized protein n=1 Tax=Labrys miyagiensis TaxID=346912 RepID=A0ABQ6CS50_9HYPH|nr:hypothetical protein GCM10007874_41190 [Labrys miyagiensis]